ncbi:unnamed protein product [Fraxinus pennsylvanica]|uniref:Uncharacterized protein n=1 Tax=Fraxinus pennsylvanica TaxID=56036 RepID=A0AAD1YQS4_9LAMI|nr:unnamed protein product [Fraxinus pennsylvanica]
MDNVAFDNDGGNNSESDDISSRKGVVERLRGEILEHFNRVEKKIYLFLQLVGRGGVQSERSGFDENAYSTHSQQNEEARVEKDVIIEDCSKEEVTPNKQHETFPIYDDGFVPDPSSAIVVYQQRL